MLKSFRRILSLVLALCLVLGMTACAGPDTNPTDPAPSTPTTPTTPATDPKPTQPSSPEDEYTLPKVDGCNQLTIYWNYTGNSATASFWIWPEGGNGTSYAVYECSYGVKCVVNIPQDVTRVGFIAIYDCATVGGDTWPGGIKDYDQDRFVDMSGDVTIYLKQGDPMIYNTKEEANSAKKVINFAAMTSLTTIKYTLPSPTVISALDQVKVMDGDRQLEVTKISSLGNDSRTGIITVSEPLDLSKVYTIEIAEHGTKSVVPTTVFDTKEFIEQYTYDGDDLGSVINADGSTTFKVWAPTASKVVLNLFATGHGGTAHANLDMNKADHGIWELTVPECGHGTYYTYSVTTAVGTQQAVDPYAKACGLNGDRGMVVDLDSTDPSGWNKDAVVELKKYTDAVIWEVHVRDFSNKIASSKYPGKYLAFTERGLKNSSGVSVGVDYLLDLGVTHVHLLPVYDFASVNESSPSFNWGYDPENYNCVEGSYSTDPTKGEVRITEFKQMVQSLHADGLGVIMDVVYNHTYDANSNLNKVVPYYYYRYDDKGSNTSASGCGNDTASERYMYRKYMVDSVTYLATEYNLDGFRFDLMGLHDLETMRQIEKAVHAVNPNAIIYGEGWTMGSTIDGSAQANQSNISKIETSEGAAGGVAVFNDAIRDGLKGSVFERTGKGYINGAFGMCATKIRFGISGGAMGGVTTWQVKNAAVINYMSAHDNNTLWDKLAIANGSDSVESRLAMNRLGAAILMISKGTPFWQAGEEILRSKPDSTKADGFNENSYNANDEVNNIVWEDLVEGSNQLEMMRYYAGLIAMRKAYGIFRSNSDDVTITFGTLANGGMTVSYAGADGSKALVLINPSALSDTFTLDGEWNLVATGTQAGAETIRVDSGAVTLDPYSVLVYIGK